MLNLGRSSVVKDPRRAVQGVRVIEFVFYLVADTVKVPWCIILVGRTLCIRISHIALFLVVSLALEPQLAQGRHKAVHPNSHLRQRLCRRGELDKRIQVPRGKEQDAVLHTHAGKRNGHHDALIRTVLHLRARRLQNAGKEY